LDFPSNGWGIASNESRGAGQSKDSSTSPGMLAIEGRPCLVVWWVGEGEVTSWEMRAI